MTSGPWPKPETPATHEEQIQTQISKSDMTGYTKILFLQAWHTNENIAGVTTNLPRLLDRDLGLGLDQDLDLDLDLGLDQDLDLDLGLDLDRDLDWALIGEGDCEYLVD